MTRQGDYRRSLAYAGVIVMLAVATFGQPVAAQAAPGPAFIVSIHPDGAADVSVRSTFDLTTDADQEAFLTLMNDEDAQANAEARFLDRMRMAANDAENATGREMRVSDPTIGLTRTSDNETGVITLSVTWAGLAASDGDSLVVTEPFASGFTTERAFHLRAPDGYLVSRASPTPDENAGHSISWEAGTALDGFSVELQPVPTTDGGTDEATQTGGQSGFGASIAVLAVLVVVVPVRRRQSHQRNQGEHEP